MKVQHNVLILIIGLTACSNVNNDKNSVATSSTPIKIITSIPSSKSDEVVLNKSDLERYKENYETLRKLANIYNLTANKNTFSQKAELLRLYESVSKQYYTLASQVYQDVIKSYPQFKLEGDLSVASKPLEPWADLKEIARSINYFQKARVDQRIVLSLGNDPSKQFAVIDSLYRSETDHSTIDNAKAEYSHLQQTYTTILQGKSGAYVWLALKEDVKRASEIKTWVAFTDEAYPTEWDDLDNERLPTQLSAKGAALANGLYAFLLNKNFAVNAVVGTDFQFKTDSEIEFPNKEESILRTIFSTVSNIITEACYDQKLKILSLYSSDDEVVPDFILGKQWIDTLKLDSSDSSYNFLAIQETSGIYHLKPVTAKTNGYEWDSTGRVDLVLLPQQYEAIQLAMYKALVKALIPRPEFKGLFDFLKNEPGFMDDAAFMAVFTSTASQLSAGMVLDLTSGMTMRDTRTGSGGGQIDLRGLSVSGVSGDTVTLGLPLFVQMKGSVDSGKTTEAALGSVAYRLGNTVVGALQAYANRGVGFGLEGQQFESSVMMSHSFGSVFLEGQLGSVSASDVHFSDWLGLRSQVTLGLDTAYVSPFVQVTYRQLDRDGHHQLKDTTASVGLDMDISSLSGDTYHIDSRLLTKAGYREKAWSQGSRDLGRVTGLQGSVEWSASLNLNSGITFSTSLGLDTVLGSNAGITVRLEQ